MPLNENKLETRIPCDNEADVKNSFGIESTLNKKHSVVVCHFTKWNVAAKFGLVCWISTKSNIADSMTKVLPEFTRNPLFGN